MEQQTSSNPIQQPESMQMPAGHPVPSAPLQSWPDDGPFPAQTARVCSDLCGRLENNFYYLALMGLLAFASVMLALMDLRTPLQGWYRIADLVIWLIFLADCLIRFVFSPNKKRFLWRNIPDLLALLPLSSMFRITGAETLFKEGRLLRFFRLFKLGRLGWIGMRGVRRVRRFLDTNGLKYVLTVTLSVIFAGAFCMTLVEDMSLGDAIWWAFVTAATVGYGDLSPATTTGRIIAVLLMLMGIGLLGSLTSSITSFFLKEKELKKAGSPETSLAFGSKSTNPAETGKHAEANKSAEVKQTGTNKNVDSRDSSSARTISCSQVSVQEIRVFEDHEDMKESDRIEKEPLNEKFLNEERLTAKPETAARPDPACDGRYQSADPIKVEMVLSLFDQLNFAEQQSVLSYLENRHDDCSSADE